MKPSGQPTAPVQEHGEARAAFQTMFPTPEAVHAGMERMEKSLRKFVPNAEDRNDVVQTTFQTVLRKADTFKGKSHLNTWLFAVARNCAHSLHGKRKLQSIDGDLCESSEPSSHDIACQREIQEQVRSTLARLRHKDSQLLHAFYIEGKPINAIQQSTNLPEGTIKRMLHTIRMRFRQEFLRQFPLREVA